eukprot:9500692-Pyramimonas_sp.AAC.1
MRQSAARAALRPSRAPFGDAATSTSTSTWPSLLLSGSALPSSEALRFLASLLSRSQVDELGR